MTFVSMFYGSTFLWVQILLVVIGVINVALAACPTVIRYADARKAI